MARFQQNDPDSSTLREGEPTRVYEVKYGEKSQEEAGLKYPSFDAKNLQLPGGTGPWRPPVVGDQVAPRATIGDVLEQVGVFSGTEPVSEKDARAIQSAEYLATGNASGVALASEARSAVDKAHKSPYTPDEELTLAEVLQDAKTRLQSDKIVTEEDAARVSEVEKRADPRGDIEPGHVAATMKEAANYNKSIQDP